MKRGIVLVVIFVIASQVADARIRRVYYSTPQTSQSVQKPQAYEPAPREGAAWDALSAEEQAFVIGLDAYRAKLGLPQLELVEQLVNDCRRWSRHLERTGRFYHGSPQENIALGHEEGELTLRQWRNSSGHDMKLRNRNDVVFGIGNCGRHWTYRATTSLENYTPGTVVKED